MPGRGVGAEAGAQGQPPSGGAGGKTLLWKGGKPLVGGTEGGPVIPNRHMWSVHGPGVWTGRGAAGWRAGLAPLQVGHPAGQADSFPRLWLLWVPLRGTSPNSSFEAEPHPSPRARKLS